jgi:hypothetical protein
MLFEDEEKKPIDINVPRFRRGDGTFTVVRFRNKADLDAFADLIDEPRLKTMKPKSQMKIKWSAEKTERDAMSQFFSGDDE